MLLLCGGDPPVVIPNDSSQQARLRNITLWFDNEHRHLSHAERPAVRNESRPRPLSPNMVEKSERSQKEGEAEVRSWGFKRVFTWTDGPYVWGAHPRDANEADC